MKSVRSWMFSLGAIAIPVAMLGHMAFAGNADQAKSKSITGAWEVEITTVNQNSTYPGLLTFFSDGNVLADETHMPLETSGHGNWVNTGENKSAYTFVFLIGSSEPGKWRKGKVSGTMEYDAKSDRWNGPFKISLVDQDGNEVLSDTGTMSGTRITAEPEKKHQVAIPVTQFRW